jgi:hypothetical protein
MHRLIIVSLSALALSTTPAVSREPAQPDKPITDRDVSAVDVATTPMTDLNIRKEEIPQLVIDAQLKPYDLNGLKSCRQIAAMVGQFDAVLGDDLDLPQVEGDRVSPGRIAQSVVGSFIPFRGIIRELSGANDQRRRMQLAIEAGMARRSFLKGVGQERGCRYPARSATSGDRDQHVAANLQAAELRTKMKADARLQPLRRNEVYR